jgi:hypothetical protein
VSGGSRQQQAVLAGVTVLNRPLVLGPSAPIVRGAQTIFVEKHGLLTQTHELTKSRRKA